MTRRENYFKTEIVERPCKENDLTAIVRAECQSEQGKISDFGYADAESSKSESPKKIIDTARNEARERVKSDAMRRAVHNDEMTTDSESTANLTAPQAITQQAKAQGSNVTQNPVTALPWNAQGNTQGNTQVPSVQGKSYAHNLRKNASSKQVDLLISLAGKKGIHLGSVVQEKYGKNIEELNSPEANALIQELK